MNKKAAAIVGGILVLGLGVFGFTKLNSGSQNQQTQQEQSAEQTTVQITDANGEKAEFASKCFEFAVGYVDEKKVSGYNNSTMQKILSHSFR